MKRYIYLGVLAITATLIFSCEKRVKNQVILAQVEHTVLTLHDLDEQIPPAFHDLISPEQKIDYVKRWIDDELLYHEALTIQLDTDKDIVADLKRLERDFLIQKLISKRLNKNITITTDEIKNYYQENISQFILEDEIVRASQIVVKDARTAWKLLSEIKRKDNFGVLAKQHSLHPSADLDGDMGYFHTWDLEPRLSKVCFQQKNGTISNPIKSDNGYHLFLITDKREKGAPKPLILVRENIINRLDKKKKQESLSEIIHELRKKFSVTTKTDVLTTEPASSLQ